MDIDLSKLSKIASGFTADVYLLDSEKVLKLYNPGWEKICIENEYNVDLLINSYYINAPRVYEMVQVEYRIGIIFQRLQNITMKDKINETPQKSIFYARFLASEHFKINSISDQKQGLLDQKSANRDIITSRISINETQKIKFLNYWTSCLLITRSVTGIFIHSILCLILITFMS